MNSLSLQALNGTGRRDAVAERFATLPPRLQREVAQRAIEYGVLQGVEEWKARGGQRLSGLGQDAMAQVIGPAIERALKPLLPTLSKSLIDIVKPAAEKAAAVVGPAVGRELRATMPKFALIAGIVAATLSILGMALVGSYVVKKVG